jgi:hypothetical protein
MDNQTRRHPLHRDDIRIRKDWVTIVAVSLFACTILSEVVLVVWLPFHLRSRNSWERETALDRMITHLDLLRAYMIDMKKKHRDSYDRGNAELVEKCLNEIARYVRDNRDVATTDQIREIEEDLHRFDALIRKFQKRHFNLRVEKIDETSYIKELLRKQSSVEVGYPSYGMDR